MSITEQQNAFVNSASGSVNLSQIFTVTAGSTNPAYLVLTALDRNEYTAGASGATGSFSGNGHTLGLSTVSGDGRGAGIVFTYQASTGRYYSSTYGYLDQLNYMASSSAGDVTSLSLFGFSSLSQATAYASSAYSLMQSDAAGYLGSATVATQAAFTGTVPTQATPQSIAAAADSLVGHAWNLNGCWVLASTVAAEGGASLPVQSTEIGLPGQANGEWIVAYNGPSGQSGNWQSMVTAGEMVVFGTSSGGGHITTCVSGTGSTAMLVDNITYENSAGVIQNAANDGSSSDVLISAPHIASQEWAGVLASSVVIYELDTPVVTVSVTSDKLAFNGAQLLGSIFTAVDPGKKGITQWQVYDTAASDSLTLNGTSYQDHSAASALGATSLSLVSLLAGSTATTDTLEVRAYNGSYWGDWAALAVAVAASAPSAPVVSAPVLSTQTAAQTWLGGRAVSLTLSGSTFTDPQGQSLTYSATLSGGQTLPSWLSFNAATDTFSGTAPTTAQNLSIVVRATDTSGLSALETLSATVVGTPVLVAATPNQSWVEGKPFSLVLAANTFSDPQGQTITYTAKQTNGQALPSWLGFNAVTKTFSGTAPSTVQSLGISVTATDSSGLSTAENFTASVQAPTISPGITVSAQTASQTWTDGQAVTLALPANTFTDALGLKMTFAAYEVSGPDITSWLRFNTTTEMFSGTAPTTASGTVRLEVIAMDAQHVTATDMFNVTLAPTTRGMTSSLGSAAATYDLHTAGVLAFRI